MINIPVFIQNLKTSLSQSPIAYRLARGAFWILVGAMISRVLGLISSILVARMLGREVYGQLGIIQSTVGMFGTFAGFGLSLTATKHVAEFKYKDPTRAGRVISLAIAVSIVTGLVMAISLIAAAPWLAANTLAEPKLTDFLRVSALILFLNALNEAQSGGLAGFEAFKTITRVNIITGIMTFPFMIIGVYLAGLWGAMWAQVFSAGLSLFLSQKALTKHAQLQKVPIVWHGWMEERSLLWRFSLPAVLSGTLVGPVNWACNAMLVNQNNGYAEMGLYNAANQLFSALLFLPGVTGQVLMPMLSEKIGIEDRVSSGKMLKLSILLNALIVFPLVIIGSLLSPHIMNFFGPSFRSAWLTLVVVLSTAGILAIQYPVGQIIAASGKMWTGVLMNFGWASAFLFLTVMLVEKGSLGLASSRSLAYLIHGIWTFCFAYKVLSKVRQEINASTQLCS